MNLKQVLIRKGLYLFTLLMSLVVGFSHAASVKLYADSWEPYNYSENGQIVGIASDLVRAVFVRADVAYDMSLQPWKRAYQNTLRTPDTGLFVVNKTAARSPNFKWVGPLFESNVYLYRLKQRSDIQINSLTDLNAYRIGVLRGGAVEDYLLKKGVSRSALDLHSHSEQHLSKLLVGRNDLAPGDEIDFYYQAKKVGRDISELTRAYRLYSSQYYLALNIETSDEIVLRLQTALDDLIEEGYRDQLIEQLFPSL